MTEGEQDKPAGLVRIGGAPLPGANGEGLLGRGLAMASKLGEKLVRFPSNGVCGTLRISAQEDSPWTGWKAEREARGAVRVPPGMALELTIDCRRMKDLRALEFLRPGDLQGLRLTEGWQYLDEGELDRAVDFVVSNPTIELSLEFSWQPSIAVSLAHLAMLAERATEVIVEGASVAAMAQIATAKGLQHLCLSWRGEEIADDGLKCLEGLENLQTLVLRRCSQVTDAGVASIAGLKSLDSLGLEGSQVTDEGLGALSGLSRLRRLSLRGCSHIGDHGMLTIGALFSLRELDISGTKVTDAGLYRLSRILPSLTWLSLWGTGVTDVGMNYLTEATLLTYLSVTELQITDDGLRAIGSLQALRSLVLGNTQVTDAGLEHLKRLHSLESLAIGSSSVFSKAAIESLSVAMPLCRIS